MPRIFITGGNPDFRAMYATSLSHSTEVDDVLSQQLLTESYRLPDFQSGHWIAEGILSRRYGARNLRQYVLRTAQVIYELPTHQQDFKETATSSAKAYVDQLRDVDNLRTEADTYGEVNYRRFMTDHDAVYFLNGLDLKKGPIEPDQPLTQ
jgi:hypothetical protein